MRNDKGKKALQGRESASRTLQIILQNLEHVSFAQTDNMPQTLLKLQELLTFLTHLNRL